MPRRITRSGWPGRTRQPLRVVGALADGGICVSSAADRKLKFNSAPRFSQETAGKIMALDLDFTRRFYLNDNVFLELAAVNREEIFVFRYNDTILDFDTHFFGGFGTPDGAPDSEQMYISSFGPLKFGTYPYPSNRRIHRSEIEVVKSNVIKILQAKPIQKLFMPNFPRTIYFNPGAFSRIEDKDRARPN